MPLLPRYKRPAVCFPALGAGAQLFLPQETKVRRLTTLSSRPERSAVERPAVSFPALGSEAQLFLPQETKVRCLTTLSSRPERSAVERPAVSFPALGAGALTLPSECVSLKV